MGHGIARNVLKHGGFTLGFLDHPGNQPTDEIVARGGHSCATVAEVVDGAEVVLLCVTGSPQVEALVAGEDGIAARLQLGAVVVDCSTSLPETTLRMCGPVSQAGGGYLDAPMTRTAKHAHEGTLNLLVGGAGETLQTVRPLLDCFAEKIDHVGPLGDGHRLKLLHNFVSLGFATLLAEAVAQAAAAGVDPDMFVEVLGAGGGASVALERLAPFIRDGKRDGLPFAVSNALKVQKLALDLTGGVVKLR